MLNGYYSDESDAEAFVEAFDDELSPEHSEDSEEDEPRRQEREIRIEGHPPLAVSALLRTGWRVRYFLTADDEF